jgi:hypothetical protein
MKFTFYLIKSFLKALSDELLQKHEVSIDHEEFMTERYILIFGSSSLILSRSFASSSSPLSVDQLIKHSQPENQMFSSLATSQGFSIIDNSDHVSTTEISKHFDKRPDRSSNPRTSVNQSIEQSKGQSSIRHSLRESSIARNFLRQSSLITENFEHLDGTLDGPSDELSNELSVESLDESRDELSDESSVEQSLKSSISSSSSPRPSAPSTSFNQPGRSSVRQSMRQLMGQLIRLAKLINAAIHVRCGIE